MCLVQTMKFLIVVPSLLPILILLGLKYSPQDPVFKYLSLHSSLKIRVSDLNSRLGNIRDISEPTSPADDVKVLTIGLQKLT